MSLKQFFLICIFGIAVNNAYSQTIIHSRYDELNFPDTLVNFKCEFDGLPANYKAPFMHALKILDQFFATDIPINVNVVYKDLEGTVIGGAKATTYFKNTSPLFIPDTYYPVALAEKILKQNLNGTDSDIQFELDSKFTRFYLGVDGNVGESQIDLVSLVLHEIIHGLGFYTNIKINSTNNTASYEYDTPTLYDRYIVDSKGNQIINLSSAELYKAIISDSLFFDTKYSWHCNNNTNPRLLAPNSFKEGSSVTHLNSTYTIESKNSLMTSIAKPLEAIHDPGDITLGIMAQLGWIEHFISINSISDTESFDDSISVYAKVDTSFIHNTIKLIYSLDNFANADTIVMEQTSDSFCAVIPPISLHFNHFVRFYVEGIDIYNNKLSSTISSVIPSYESFFIGDDTVKPILYHTPRYIVKEEDTVINFTATATDNIGVKNVFVVLSFKDKDNSLKNDTIPLELNNREYSAEYEFKNRMLYEYDNFTYKIFAIDNSKKSNIGAYPTSSVLNVNVFRKANLLKRYINDFETNDSLFDLDSFAISTPNNFSNGCLHTKNPYDNSGADNIYITSIAELTKPICVSPIGAVISFDEVVLVEPCDYGVSFGEFGFWDFVIVEGSKDKITWHAFEMEGYDSRSKSIWFDAYYSDTDVKGNSLIKGTENLYVHHDINMLRNKFIRPLDTIYVRFRLQSDANKVGDGWYIDNLEIQKDAPVQIFEKQMKHVEFIFDDISKTINITSSNSNNSEYTSSIVSPNGSVIVVTSEKTISYSNLPSGLYFIQSISSDGMYVEKFIVK